MGFEPKMLKFSYCRPVATPTAVLQPLPRQIYLSKKVFTASLIWQHFLAILSKWFDVSVVSKFPWSSFSWKIKNTGWMHRETTSLPIFLLSFSILIDFSRVHYVGSTYIARHYVLICQKAPQVLEIGNSFRWFQIA